MVKGKAADHWYPTKNADSWAKGTPVPRGGERQAPGTSFLVHSAAITGFYVALLRIGRGGWTLLAWERESAAKEPFRARERERKIVPDAFIALRAGDPEHRAFIGTSAKGRSKLYHYYTCSTRYRYGTKECGADWLPREDLEQAVFEQMVDIYRDSGHRGCS